MPFEVLLSLSVCMCVCAHSNVCWDGFLFSVCTVALLHGDLNMRDLDVSVIAGQALGESPYPSEGSPGSVGPSIRQWMVGTARLWAYLLPLLLLLLLLLLRLGQTGRKRSRFQVVTAVSSLETRG